MDDKGSFFGIDNGWGDFHARSTELARSGQYQFVLIADIADYYNQMSQHRTTNALETANVARERASNLERILSQLAGGHSRGLPVGPHASIILAEATMHDVDAFLLGRGRPHVRYVDDFRIFCSSKRVAISALHDLTPIRK